MFINQLPSLAQSLTLCLTPRLKLLKSLLGAIEALVFWPHKRLSHESAREINVLAAFKRQLSQILEASQPKHDLLF